MSGELEPNDSRNVTGTASTPDGHWTAQGQQPPLANGQSPESQAEQEPTRAQGGGGLSGGGLSEDGAGDMSEDVGSSTAGGGGFTSDQQLIHKVGVNGGAGGLSNEGEGEDMENPNKGSGMSGTDKSAHGQQQQFDQGRAQMGDGQQSGSLSEQIREHMTVVDAEGTQVGTVDSVIDDQIKLTRSGSSDGQHHYLAIDRVAGIEGDTVRLHEAGESVFSSNDS